MGISLSDIRRAVAEGGDLAVFAEIYLKALSSPPVSSRLATDQSTPLPDPWSILRFLDPEMAACLTGQTTNPALIEKMPDSGLTLVALPPNGKKVGRYLEHLLTQVQPDIIALDEHPFKLSASMLYTLSLSCAAGLPAEAEIMYSKTGQLYDGEHFLPGSLNETALILGWTRNIPLVPLGHPGKPLQPEIYSQHGYLYDAYFWSRWQSALTAAWRDLDAGLDNASRLRGKVSSLEDSSLEDRLAEKIGRGLMESLSDEIDRALRESLRRESCYAASRLLDLALFNRQRGKKARILALVDVVHYVDLRQVIPLFLSSRSLDLFQPFEIHPPAGEMLITGRKRVRTDQEQAVDIPADSLAQRIFRREFSAFIAARDTEKLAESETRRMIAEIAARLRSHPDIARGVSVRGTIAFEEVLGGFAVLNQGLTRESLLKAALVTLPPRVSLKLKGDEKALVRDIVHEVIYGFRYSTGGYHAVRSGGPEQLSTDEILDSLEKLGPLPAREKPDTGQAGLPAVLSDNDKKMASLKYLEALEYIKKDRQGKYSFTQKAVERMLSELERQFGAGEITRQEYDNQKARLSTLMKNLNDPQYRMSDKERACTIMEMLDAQDKGWNSGVNFNLMHLYYHVKQTSEGADLSPQKRDYYALGRLIDEFAQQQMLKKVNKESGYVLTGIALDTLYKYLMNGKHHLTGFLGIKDKGQEISNERKQETRRYSSGDAFRDISVRHTLRALAKQKKALGEIRSNNLRVYLKQTRQPQSDIVICIDTSGSMGFHHELVYARLVASGLVQAAIRNRDRVGLVAFSDYGQIAVPLTEKDGASLIDCIAGLSIRGNTNIGDGLKCAAGILFRDRTGNQKYIILVTDGQPTALSEKVFSRLKTLQGKDLTEESALIEARQAAARGAVISVIHIAGEGQNGSAFIRNIARIGRGTVRRLSNADDLRVVLH